MAMEGRDGMIPACSHSTEAPLPDAESLFSSALYEMSQQIQSAMENMLRMTSEVDQSSSEITEEVEKCKESCAARQKFLEEERERVQKAAYSVLEMLRG